jgi:farnesyl-diphosphate farnesyltransferase
MGLVLLQMFNGRGKQLLKGVSRSFYISLRLLPAPMRRAASLGYLLARTSDTIADTDTAPIHVRRECLSEFSKCIGGLSKFSNWPNSMVDAVGDSRERHLLDKTYLVLLELKKIPESEALLIRELLETIISGQELDLIRFGHTSFENPVALLSAAELEDYTWRVAGCVGEFWTKLGFLTLGKRFSDFPENELIERGIAYGKSLQLVNILRDLAEDLAVGRCYLPVKHLDNTAELLEIHAIWLEKAEDGLADGEFYADQLKSRFLRVASVLPALLARKTLEPMRGKTWSGLKQRIKIPRRAVYDSMIKAFFKTPKNH